MGSRADKHLELGGRITFMIGKIQYMGHGEEATKPLIILTNLVVRVKDHHSDAFAVEGMTTISQHVS